MARPRAGLPRNGVSILGRENKFFFSSESRDRLWLPWSLLFNGEWGYIPGVTRAGVETEQ